MWRICKETMNARAEDVCGWKIGKKKSTHNSGMTKLKKKSN